MSKPTAKLSRIDATSLSSNPRATLDAWKKFEPFVEAAIRRHPTPYILSPDFLSVETFISRIRDAIRGKIAFDYPSNLTTDVVRSWYSEVIVKAVDKSSVYIGPKEKLATLVSNATEKHEQSYDSLDPTELAAFALLLSNGRLVGPIIVRNPPATDTLPQYPNFQTLSRPDGSLVLL